MTNEVRIGVKDIPGYFQYQNPNYVGGAFGQLFTSYYKSALKNVTFVKGSDEESIRESISSLMERKAVDTSLLFDQYTKYSNIVDSSLPLLILRQAASHSPVLRMKSTDLLSSLFIYSTLTTMLFLISTLIIAPFWIRTTTPGKLVYGFGQAIRCLINQPNAEPILTRFKVVILAWLLASFAAIGVYENSINAEMVSSDYSQVVESIEDLDRLTNYVAVFGKGDFLDYPNRGTEVQKRIWCRSSTKVLEPNTLAFLELGKPNQVIIGLEPGAVRVTEHLCSKSKSFDSVRKTKPKYLISWKGFGEVTMAHIYRKDLNASLKAKLDSRFLNVAEKGILEGLINFMGHKSHLLDQNANSQCIRYSKNDLYDDVNKLRPIKYENFETCFLLFLIFSAIGVLVFFVEFMKRLRIRIP